MLYTQQVSQPLRSTTTPITICHLSNREICSEVALDLLTIISLLRIITDLKV